MLRETMLGIVRGAYNHEVVDIGPNPYSDVLEEMLVDIEYKESFDLLWLQNIYNRLCWASKELDGIADFGLAEMICTTLVKMLDIDLSSLSQDS